MPIEVTMPRLSDTMEQGTVVKWNGDRKDYDFPAYPLYWKVMGPNKSGGADLRPLFKKAS